ncbi:putative reverse transcriptase domain-containing protein [Tanacetum coccineum]
MLQRTRQRSVHSGDWHEQEEVFQTLKDNLCNAPILSLPDGAEDFVVYYDVSNQGLGCVLMQRGKMIAYASGQLELLLVIEKERKVGLQEIRYHPGKANVVADALSRKEKNEATKEKNAPAEMLRGLDQQIEK